MSRRSIAACLCLLWLLFVVPTGLFSEEKLSLSLEDCLLGAMKHNLRIAAEKVSPEMADMAVTRAVEVFLPSLSFSYDQQETNSASYSFIDASGQVSTSIQNYRVNFDQVIPTGGRIFASLTSYRNENNRSFQTINPRYGSTLTFNFVQPLLKNFGWGISRRDYIIARNSLDVSESQFRRSLTDIIYSVEEAYWNLVYSLEYLKVRESSLKLARDLLEESRRKVEVGTLAPIELFTSEAEVATREADILQAQAMVENSRSRLRTIVNMPEFLEKKDMVIEPTDQPRFEPRIVEFEEALSIALEKRPDLEALRSDLKNREFNVRYAGNQLLPELNLTASYWSPGISGNRILYLNDNALTGVVVGNIPGAPSNALKDAFHFKYDNWSIALTLDIPLKSALTRADYSIARAQLRQARLRMKDMERELEFDLQTAIRAVDTGFKRKQAYTSARELAEKKLEAESEKLRVGKSTNYLLLQFQRDLADARTIELKAIVDYTLALSNLDRVMGLTFEAKNIAVSNFLSDEERTF